MMKVEGMDTVAFFQSREYSHFSIVVHNYEVLPVEDTGVVLVHDEFSQTNGVVYGGVTVITNELLLLLMSLAVKIVPYIVCDSPLDRLKVVVSLVPAVSIYTSITASPSFILFGVIYIYPFLFE